MLLWRGLNYIGEDIVIIYFTLLTKNGTRELTEIGIWTDDLENTKLRIWDAALRGEVQTICWHSSAS